MERERRTLSTEVRAREGEKPGLTGTFSVYDRQYDTGWFIETIKPGAFSRVLDSSPDVAGLFNHDPNMVLARTPSTMRLSDSPEGARYDMDTDPETSVGRDVQRMVQRGDVKGCSFSFTVAKQGWREEKSAEGQWTLYRDIEEIDQLFDVGPVTFPAYTDTTVAARSMWPEGVPAEVRSHVPALARSAEQTKKVDGEDLTRKCFLLVGDPDKTDTWELPWKFSTDEKTKSHLRDALARFNQVEGFSEEALEKAWSKLLMLCDHYDIDVASKTRPGAKKSKRGAPDGDPDCNCPCDACGDGRCADCDCAGCQSLTCAGEDCGCEGHRSRQLARALAHIHAAS